MNWVYTAYGITWAIIIAYLVILTRGFQRVRVDIADLDRR